MFGKVGIVQSVLPYEEEPEYRWCKSGHVAPKVYTPRGGPPVPCRFIRISGPDIPARVAGVYCEACISAANVMAEKQKRSVF